jgi:hypothetical protein
VPTPRPAPAVLVDATPDADAATGEFAPERDASPKPEAPGDARNPLT